MSLPLTSSPDSTNLRSSDRATAVLRNLLHDRISQVSFALVAAVVGIGYSVLLTFEFTQRIGWRNWHYLDARSLAFSVAFGVATGWIVAVQVYATRRIIAVRGSALAGTGAALGLLPSLLCCTPILPTLLSVIGLSGASLAGTSSRTQSFFTTNQNAILSLSLALVTATGVWTTRRLLRATCLTDDGCAVGGQDAQADAQQVHACGEDASRPTTSMPMPGPTHG